MSSIPKCEKCGNAKAWIECANCDDGFSGHDCGEDCCCCADPEPNVICDVCRGEGGWWACLDCADPQFVKQFVLDGRVSWPE
jgi:hypothetical protein